MLEHPLGNYVDSRLVKGLWSYFGHIQLHRQFSLLDQDSLIWLATANHKDKFLGFRIRFEMQRLLEVKVKILS